MQVITKKEAHLKALAETSEGMHFKGQFLPKENYFLFGKKVNFICKATDFVSLVEYKGAEYFISNDILLK